MNIYYQHVFLINKYTATYIQIIEQAKLQEASRRIEYSTGRYERHHIIPRSIDPNIADLRKNPENGVLLTFKEHFIAHWLLTKMCIDDNHRRKMLLAMKYMTISNQLNNRIISSWQYAVARSSSIAAITGTTRSLETRKKISENRKGKGKDYRGESHHQFGKKHKPETIEKMIQSRTGLKRTEETKRKLSEGKLGKKNHMFGKKMTEGHKSKIKAHLIGSAVSEDTKNKISDSLNKSEKMKRHHENLKDRIRITNGQHNTSIRPDEEIPVGYRRGITKVTR